MGTMGWRERCWNILSCKMDGAGLADQGGRKSAEDVQAVRIRDENAGGAAVLEVKVAPELGVDLLVHQEKWMTRGIGLITLRCAGASEVYGNEGWVCEGK